MRDEGKLEAAQNISSLKKRLLWRSLKEAQMSAGEGEEPGAVDGGSQTV